MAGTSPRQARVAGLIQRVIATCLERDIRDPRLEGVTITEVRVTGDLQIAHVYWTQLADPHDERGARKRAAKALERAKGRLRSRVGRRAGLRLTPSIEFIFDEVPGQARQIDDLLAYAEQRDEQLRKSRQGKAFSGDADPYRHDDGPSATEAGTSAPRKETKTAGTTQGKSPSEGTIPIVSSDDPSHPGQSSAPSSSRE